MNDEAFAGTCPTCGQAYLKAEIERLKAALQEIAENAFDIESAMFAADVLRNQQPEDADDTLQKIASDLDTEIIEALNGKETSVR